MRVALVSYINTWPFVWGLEESGEYELILDIPSRCMSHFENGKAEIALVPVGTLTQTTVPHQIIPGYCIGAKKRVETVVLLANDPLDQLQAIRLDPESATSNLLVQVLGKYHWKINVQYFSRENPIPEPLPLVGDVCIGDKVFTLRSRYSYCVDLAQAWYAFSGKAFPFAIWIGKPDLSPQQIESFVKALKKGIDSLSNPSSLSSVSLNPDYVAHYLKEVIDYHLDGEKLESFSLFKNLVKDVASVHLHK